MKTPIFATAYENRKRQVLDCSHEPSMTQQSAKDECDINNILKRYEKTGILPDLIREDGAYGDFSEVPEYQEALNIVEKAQFQFNSLDGHLRKRFDNEPAKFLEFCQNPANLEEMYTLGLAIRPEPKIEPVVTAPATEVQK